VPKIDRKEIAMIIKRNIPLLKINSDIAYDLADCIMLYYIVKGEKKNGES